MLNHSPALWIGLQTCNFTTKELDILGPFGRKILHFLHCVVESVMSSDSNFLVALHLPLLGGVLRHVFSVPSLRFTPPTIFVPSDIPAPEIWPG